MIKTEVVIVPDDVSELQPGRPTPELDSYGWVDVDASVAPAEVQELRLFLMTASADQIADTLRGFGAKGRRGDLEHYPISNFGAACVPKAVSIETDINGVRVTVGDDAFKLTFPGVTEFVKNFDNGFYPDLVE